MYAVLGSSPIDRRSYQASLSTNLCSSPTLTSVGVFEGYGFLLYALVLSFYKSSKMCNSFYDVLEVFRL